MMSTRTKPRARRPIALMIALVASTLCVAACGSSSPSGSSPSAAVAATPSAAATGARGKFAACLKQHGVTLPAFRRPGSGAAGAPPAGGQPGYNGGGFFFGGGRRAGAAGAPGAAARLANPKFRAAFQACGSLLPARRFQRPALSHTAINKFVACVRNHGYKLPAPNFSGSGPVFPATIRTNAKFQAAARSCTSLLRPTGARGSAAGGGTSGGGTTGA